MDRNTQPHTRNGYFKLVVAFLYIQSGFFSHSIKLLGLPLSTVTTSLYHSKQQHAAKRLLLQLEVNHVVVTQWRPTPEESAPKFDHAKERTQVNCKITTAWHQDRELALVQCARLTGKETVIARIKSNNRNWAADFMFSRKFWFLGPISRGCKCPFCPPLRTPMLTIQFDKNG